MDVIEAFSVTVWLICASVQDIRHRRLHPAMLIIGAGISLWIAIYGCLHGERILPVVAGAIPGVLFWWLGHITRCIGSADGIVLTIIGICVDWKKTVVVWLISMFLIGVGAMVYVVWKPESRRKKLPYIPFLTIAFAVYFMCGGQ